MKKTEKKTYLEAIGIITWLGSIISMFLVAHTTATVTGLLILCTVYLYMSHRASDDSNKYRTIIRYILSGICLSMAALWVFTKNYYMLLILQMFSSYIGVFEVIAHLAKKSKAWKKGGEILDRFAFIAWILLLIVMGVLSVFLIYVAISPNWFAYQFRGEAENSIEAPATETVQLDNGYYYTNDIQYSERYANGYFDIYSETDDFTEEKPVFIYVHGGYWVYGDKVNGDPNAEEQTGYYAMIERMIDEGFTVLSVNYALAPEYSYPTPIHQMEDLAYFLKEHGVEYGFDTSKIVYGGGTSGAQIAAQFVVTQTDESYAKEMNIEQVFTDGEIKAVYLGTALLDPTRVTDSDVFFFDYMLYQMTRSYYVADSMKESLRAAQADIIEHVTEDFPATYITDGNYMSYYHQADELAEKFEELNVEYEMLNFNQDEYEGELIMQGYDLQISEFAEMNLDKMVEFLKAQVE